jgi:hypothetical protein
MCLWINLENFALFWDDEDNGVELLLTKADGFHFSIEFDNSINSPYTLLITKCVSIENSFSIRYYNEISFGCDQVNLFLV